MHLCIYVSMYLCMCPNISAIFFRGNQSQSMTYLLIIDTMRQISKCYPITCQRDPHGSYGFCLLSNAAIAAAYARHMYRHQGVQRVAIIDFDVHHGNGTEACIRNVQPTMTSKTFTSTMCETTVKTHSYKPWLNEQDKDNIFFASVHGFGENTVYIHVRLDNLSIFNWPHSTALYFDQQLGFRGHC
jgi:hypothetical protein